MARRNRLAILVLVAVGLIMVGVGTLTAYRARENSKGMRAAVAKLGLHELLQRQRVCELGTGSGLDPAYCTQVGWAIASQPLQLVDLSPDDSAEYEHDKRSIEWSGKSALPCLPGGSVCMAVP